MKKIVIGYDASAQARDALRLAEMLCVAGDAELIVAAVHEVEPLAGGFGHSEVEREDYFASMVASAAAELGRTDFTQRISAGSAAAALDDIALSEQADLIVIGSTHRGRLGQAFPGSVGERLLRGAPCAVAIAPVDYAQTPHPPLQRIGVGFDGRKESEAALRTAERLAEQLGTELRLIAVAPIGEGVVAAGSYSDGVRAQFAEQLKRGARTVAEQVAIDPVLVTGDPARQLAAQGVELDLLVIGSRAYGPLHRVLLGTVAHEVVRLAPCPVLVLPRSGKGGPEESSERRDANAASA